MNIDNGLFRSETTLHYRQQSGNETSEIEDTGSLNCPICFCMSNFCMQQTRARWCKSIATQVFPLIVSIEWCFFQSANTWAAFEQTLQEKPQTLLPTSFTEYNSQSLPPLTGSSQQLDSGRERETMVEFEIIITIQLCNEMQPSF